MNTWLAERESYCPWCKAWIYPDAAWEIDPPFVLLDDNSPRSSTLSARVTPEDQRRFDVDHYPDLFTRHSFVGTMRRAVARSA